MFISRFNQKWNFWKANEMLFGQVVWRAKPNLWLFGKKKSKYACKWGMHSNDRNPLMSVTMRCCRVCFLVIFVAAKGYMRVGKLSRLEALVNVSWVLNLECVLEILHETLQTEIGWLSAERRRWKKSQTYLKGKAEAQGWIGLNAINGKHTRMWI